MNPITSTTRRHFLSGSGAMALSLKYGAVSTASAQSEPGYRRWEDIMRNKWTWDRVVRGSRGVNCTGHCAFNVYVRNGIVWREEQQGEYGSSGDDTPDYGPRGCQKGLRQAKHMYGKQRVLYPMKRIGERGEGKWERESWDDALDDIANRFVDYAAKDGPDSITMAMGTAMILKRAAFTGLFRFANITGLVIPETFAGVGDLPIGAQQTIGHPLPGDNMAAVYKSKTCLVWACNPAATRIPDAHFFWEARYNGTEVVVISPDFSASAIHASKWLNPKPGTDLALAMAMVNVILEDRTIDWDYVREQTDLPFLVRKDTERFLRAEDMEGGGEHGFYVWDEATGAIAQAPATNKEYEEFYNPEFSPVEETLTLGALEPALEGSWTVETKAGPVEVTTVFELTKNVAAEYTPAMAAEITGVSAENIRAVARSFASNGPGMIFAGYRANKWLHGDLLNRAWLLMCALTGDTGREGGGLQTTNLPKADGMFKLVFDGLGPRIRIASLAVWDYAKSDGKQLNASAYGQEMAEHIDRHYQEAKQKYWLPDYAAKPWKMAIMAGHNPVSWRASGDRFLETTLSKVETMVAMTPDMSATAMYSDYVLPVAHMYERRDMTMEGRTPYAQVLDKAVEPLGESLDDWAIMEKLSKKISQIAAQRGMGPIEDNMFGNPVPRDYTKVHEQFTLNGKLGSDADVVEYLLQNSMGMPKISFKEFAEKGLVRPDNSDGTQFGAGSPFSYQTLASTRDKKPYKTLTGRQQYYLDHDVFLAEGEQLPVYRPPLMNKNFDLRLTMGHARHSIHSLWRDDSLLLSLQRGEPDVYVNPDDAQVRGVEDGDLIRVYNDFGSFIAMAHVSSSMQPKQLFMYHGWDPMMFRNRQNFNAVIPTAGLIKPNQMVGDYGHLNYRPPDTVPNQTHHDSTVEFEKYSEDADQVA
ncbi:MAG: molybdopterin-dependent oxidoreductase [Gammaproteobacteria bacterium]